MHQNIFIVSVDTARRYIPPIHSVGCEPRHTYRSFVLIWLVHKACSHNSLHDHLVVRITTIRKAIHQMIVRQVIRIWIVRNLCELLHSWSFNNIFKSPFYEA